MKISFSRLWLICLTILVASTALTSCDDNDYYYSPLEGTWTLGQINGIPVSDPQISEFTFYSNGTGVYGQYNPFPQWSTYSIEWELDYGPGGEEYLYIYPAWTSDVWEYRIWLYPSRMVLTDLLTGQQLTYYD